jgi:hypothetical protein
MFPGWNGCTSLSGAEEVQAQLNLTLFKLQVIEISTQPSVRNDGIQNNKI